MSKLYNLIKIKSYLSQIERHIVPMSFQIDYGSQAAIKSETQK